MNEVHIGNPRGRIALWLDESEAIDMAYHYGSGDRFYDELMQAVERAYPPPSSEPGPGIRLTVSMPSRKKERWAPRTS